MYKSHGGNERTNSNLTWRNAKSVKCNAEEELIQKSLKALIYTTDPLDKLRQLCLTRGVSGILRFGKIFREVVGNNEVNHKEFAHAIQETGSELTNQETDKLFKRFDKEQSGSINLDEFLNQIRPLMPESRQIVLEQIFNKLNKTGNGVYLEDIRNLYSSHTNSKYVNGEDPAELILNKFLINFDQQEKTKNRMVTFEEFMNYYSGISVAIENDCFFDRMMRKAYGL